MHSPNLGNKLSPRQNWQVIFLRPKKVFHKPKKGHRWTWKKRALSFLHVYPKAYKKLKSILYLPSEKILRCCIRNLDIKPGISKGVIKLLSEKTKYLKKEDTFCTLIMDETTVTKKSLSYNSTYNIFKGFKQGRIFFRHSF